METQTFDVAVIGAGAAGLAAAAVIAGGGRRVLVIDREATTGGVLRQCIHNGFGLRYFQEELTGPEFADLMTEKAVAGGAYFALNTTVSEIRRMENGDFTLTMLSAADGVREITVSAVFLAMGCRERNRGNIASPGSRPAGIFTAGTAQKLLNMEGLLPGRSAVIVGSGDIGLIMARRLRWCGIKVEGVVEIMPHPSGLTRNVVQCLNDFDIPLYLAHSVVNICGRDRVEGVDVAPLVSGAPDMTRKFRIACDTLLFSVGLVPETELAIKLGVELDPATGGAKVDAGYETAVQNVFSAGNVLHVHDLVDFVAEEAERAAGNVLERLAGKSPRDAVRVSAADNLKYVVPSGYFPGEKTIFAFRPLVVADRCVLRLEIGGVEKLRKVIPFVRPAEMISIVADGKLLDGGEAVFKLEKEEE